MLAVSPEAFAKPSSHFVKTLRDEVASARSATPDTKASSMEACDLKVNGSEDNQVEELQDCIVSVRNMAGSALLSSSKFSRCDALSAVVAQLEVVKPCPPGHAYALLHGETNLTPASACLSTFDLPFECELVAVMQVFPEVVVMITEFQKTTAYFEENKDLSPDDEDWDPPTVFLTKLDKLGKKAEAAISYFRENLQSAQPKVRELVVWSLGKLAQAGVANVLPDLRAMLSDSCETVVLQVIRSIVESRILSKKNAPADMAKLALTGFQSPHARIRSDMLYALSGYIARQQKLHAMCIESLPEWSAIVDQVVKFLTDTEKDVRRRSFRMLAKVDRSRYKAIFQADLLDSDAWLASEKQLAERLQRAHKAKKPAAARTSARMLSNGCESEEELRSLHLLKAQEADSSLKGRCDINAAAMPVKQNFKASELRKEMHNFNQPKVDGSTEKQPLWHHPQVVGEAAWLCLPQHQIKDDVTTSMPQKGSASRNARGLQKQARPEPIFYIAKSWGCSPNMIQCILGFFHLSAHCQWMTQHLLIKPF
jgi:HEAT repeat protein